jgi:hypothetical protein
MSELLRLNLSDDEAGSTAREYTVLPTGSYICNIIEVNEKTVKPGSNNVGKPYWNVKLVVDQGHKEYDGKPIYANLMLFKGAAFLVVQLVRATFPELIEGNDISIPRPESLCGKRVTVVGRKFVAGSDIKKGGKPTGRKRDTDQFEVTGFKTVEEPARPAGNTTLLS